MKIMVSHCIIGITIIVFLYYGSFILPREIASAAELQQPISSITSFISNVSTSYGVLELSVAVSILKIGFTIKDTPRMCLAWVIALGGLIASWILASYTLPAVYYIGLCIVMCCNIVIGYQSRKAARDVS